MITDLKPYPAMKDSGVEWLGEVPEHWEPKKLRTVLTNVTARNRPDLPLLSVVRERGVIIRDVANQDENRNFIPDDLTNYKVVRAGQFAMNKMKAWQGSYGVSRHDGIVSPAYFVFDLEGMAGDFFNTAIRSKAYVPFFTQASDGVRIGQWDLSQARMREILFAVPSPGEQVAIVRYLDHVDRRVRRLVRAKRKLIALLTEQKQAIIHRAVTRGLDPDAPLKDSGVEWLGQVPEHWEVLALRRRWSITDCKHLTVPFVDNESAIPLASVREVQSFELSLAEAKRTTYENYISLIEGGRKPRPGDLIYCRNVSVGASAIVTSDEPFAMGQDVCLIRSKNQNQRFLNYYLRSLAMERQLALLLVGSTFNRINVADIKSLIIAVPSRAEQDGIASFLDDSLVEAEQATSNAKNETALLNEYRTSLIADVVTGKLDVRDAAAKLSAEPDKSEPLDEVDDMDDTEEIEVEELEA